MNRTINKLAALGLTLTLAACTSVNANSSAGNTPAADSETQASQTESAAQTTENNEDTQAPETAAPAEEITVKLGIMGGSDEVVWDPIVAEFEDKGIHIEYVYFSDYTQPNAALDAGDIDLNSFQHYTYLNNEKEKFGYKIDAIGDTLITALNVYSKKIDDISELPEGGKIAIPNDAVNGGRALNVLQAAGVLTLEEGKELTPTVADIAENPKNIEIVEVDASQTASLLPDVDAAVINGGFALDAGLSPIGDSIFFDDPSYYKTNAYVNIIAARTEDLDNELYKEIVKAYQTDRTKGIYANDFQGLYIAAWKDDDASSEDFGGVTVKLGIMGGSDEEIWDPVKAAVAEKGINIEYVFFTDYTQPNAALANGDIDLNAFQHYAYLNDEKSNFGYEIESVGDTYITALNLYSTQHKSIDEIPDGGTIAIPNDAVNGGRALRIIQASGLIKLADDDNLTPTVSDIAENPKNINFVEVDASQTVTLLADADAAVANSEFIVDAGFAPRDIAIFIDDPSFYKTNNYVNVIVARSADKDDPVYKEIVKAYQTEKTKEIYLDVFQGLYVAAWE
ncbi:MAG: hypothetical protein ILP19_09100 [Oscillospiraceae bacterium]|nr:hypothetical protein [Oscillospiraceae bacterium]